MKKKNIATGTKNEYSPAPKVVICGAYGQGNAGDEAILEAIVRRLRQEHQNVDITVLTRDPEGTSSKLGVSAVYSFDIPGFLRALSGAGLFISGGGSLIQDVTSRRSLWYYLFTIAAAKRRGVKVLMYGCGIGPVNYPGDQNAAKRIINKYVDIITLREEHSQKELERFGVNRPEIILSSDPALTLPAAEPEKVDELMVQYGLETGGKYICFALRDWAGFEDKCECFAKTADMAYEKYGLKSVFLSINSRNDGAAAEKAMSKMVHPSIIIKDPLPSGLAMGLLSRMTAVVSMRLHGLIFAAGQGVPLVGVSYDPKVTAFMDYIGQNTYAGLEGISTDILWELIERAIALSGDRERLLARTNELRAIENRNIDAALRLLGN